MSSKPIIISHDDLLQYNASLLKESTTHVIKLTILNNLLAGTVAAADIKKVGIHRTVHHIYKSSNEPGLQDLKNTAKKLVYQWKILLKEEKKTKILSKIAAPPPKNINETSKVSNKIRQEVINRISKILENEKIAESIESEIFKKHKETINDNYKENSKTIIANLQQNKELCVQIKNGNILPAILVSMDPKEMASEDIKNFRKKVEKDSFESRRTDWLYAKIRESGKEGIFTCGKCKGKRTVYYQQQTRRADEGMTTFVTCIDCNNRWKC